MNRFRIFNQFRQRIIALFFCNLPESTPDSINLQADIMESTMKRLKWIESGGGPFILAPADICSLWTGVYNREKFSRGKLELAKDFMDASECDYGRACRVNGYLSPLTLGNGTVLVIGDEPMAASVFVSKRNVLCLARWSSGESMQMVEEKLSEFDSTENSGLENPLEFYISSGKQFLFDSSVCSSEFENETGRYTELNMQQGTYLINTFDYGPDDLTFLIIHEFNRIA